MTTLLLFTISELFSFVVYLLCFYFGMFLLLFIYFTFPAARLQRVQV